MKAEARKIRVAKAKRRRSERRTSKKERSERTKEEKEKEGKNNGDNKSSRRVEDLEWRRRDRNIREKSKEVIFKMIL